MVWGYSLRISPYLSYDFLIKLLYLIAYSIRAPSTHFLPVFNAHWHIDYRFSLALPRYDSAHLSTLHRSLFS